MRPPERGLPVVLAVGGFDPTGGAGVTADVMAIAMVGALPRAAVAVITVQGEGRVVTGMPVDADVLRDQMQACVEGRRLAAVKTGALGSSFQVACVAGMCDRHPGASLVVDPVIEASAGGRLFDQAGERALRESLLPVATLVTPNLAEASLLAGMDGPCMTRERMSRAASRILETGARWVLVKGGHLEGPPADLLAGPDGYAEWIAGPRIDVRATHGTGCMLASAAAAALALGHDVPAAARRARELVARALREAPGPDPAPDLVGIWRVGSAGRWGTDDGRS